MSESIHDTCYIWWLEMKNTFKDEGVLIFFILVPLGYPILYSWIYNNERVHDVPVAVVDNSHSQLSRAWPTTATTCRKHMTSLARRLPMACSTSPPTSNKR